MPYRYADIAFTDAVKSFQEVHGSRQSYQQTAEKPDDRSYPLGADEIRFVEAADSFYMASVSETGWPYMQHRGGPRGFVRHLGGDLLGFADFRGNKQYISIGNLKGNDRVSLLFMDYPNKARLKLFARARLEGLDDPKLNKILIHPDYKARPERHILLKIEAFDWNCPQHITQRFSLAQIEALAASDP